MSLHADTLDYLDRLAVAGGTISSFNTALVDTIIKALYNTGLRGGSNLLRYWLRLNLTESYAGCFVPVFDDGVGNATPVGSFSTANWSSSLGITNDGSSLRYLDSGWNITTKLGTQSTTSSSLHIATWITGSTVPSPSGNVGVMGGAIDDVTYADYVQIYLSSDPGDIYLVNASCLYNFDIYGYDIPVSGFFLLNRPDITTCRFLQNDTLLGTITGINTTVVSPNFTIPLGATREPGSGVTNAARISVSDYTMGLGLTETQQTNLYQSLAITEPVFDTYYNSPLMLLC